MIKNLGLISFFLILIGIGWRLENQPSSTTTPNLANISDSFYLIEKGEFEISSLTGLELPAAKVDFTNKDSQSTAAAGAIVEDISYPANLAVINELLKRFKEIALLKELRVLPGKRKDFFSKNDWRIKLLAQDKEFEFRIGDVSELSGNFYIEVLTGEKQGVFLAKDMSFYEGLYKNELEADLGRHKELVALVQTPPEGLADKRVFLDLLERGIRSLKVDSGINRWFSLDFQKKITVPPPPKGIAPAINNETLAGLLNHALFSGIISKKDVRFQNSLDKPFSTIEFFFGDKDGGSKLAKLYKAKDQDQLYYLEYPSDYGSAEAVFLIKKQYLGLFFGSAQHFWIKKPNLGNQDLSKLNSLSFSLGQSPSKMENLIIADLKSFEIKAENPAIKIEDRQYYNLVFNALFANNGLEQAEFVNQLGANEMKAREEGLSQKIYLKVFGKIFALSIEAQEMILLDLEDRTEFRYNVGEVVEELSLKHFFVFKTQQG